MRNDLTVTPAGKVFLDTNILIHALDVDEPGKQRRCRKLLTDVGRAGSGVVSTQIMQEIFSVSIRKLRLSALGAKAVVADLRGYEIVQMTPAVIEAAMDCVILHRVSIWDALILAAAASAGCRTLYTEDLQAGTTLLGVRVENPLA